MIMAIERLLFEYEVIVMADSRCFEVSSGKITQRLYREHSDWQHFCLRLYEDHAILVWVSKIKSEKECLLVGIAVPKPESEEC